MTHDLCSTLDPHPLSRRGFLKAATWTLASSPVLAPRFKASGSESGQIGEGFIDAHVHVWTPEIRRYPLAEGYSKNDMQPRSFRPKQLFSHCRPVGVDRIVLIQMSFYGYDNSYMLDMMKRHKGVFSGVAVIDETAQPRKRMRDLAQKGVRGFRIQPGKVPPEKAFRSEGMATMWTVAAEEGLKMCPLINPEYLPAIDRMCAKYPQTPVVVDHFGRVGIDGRIRQKDLENLCRLARHKNTFVKVSAFYALGKKTPPYTDLIPMIRRVLEAFGPERLMWASDCPFQVQDPHTYQASIDLIRKRCDFLSQGDAEWLLRKTAEQVFFA